MKDTILDVILKYECPVLGILNEEGDVNSWKRSSFISFYKTGLTFACAGLNEFILGLCLPILKIYFREMSFANKIKLCYCMKALYPA